MEFSRQRTNYEILGSTICRVSGSFLARFEGLVTDKVVEVQILSSALGNTGTCGDSL